MISIEKYKENCDSFFKEGSFQSQEHLMKEIGAMAPEDFQIWQTKMFTEYNVHYECIRKFLHTIRTKEGFDINDENIDWKKDPIQKLEHKEVIDLYRDVFENAFTQGLSDFDIYDQKKEQLKEYWKQKQYEESLNITIDGKDFVAEKIIEVLWPVAESSSNAWLINDNGVKKLAVSDNGHIEFADAEFLEEKIQAYEDILEKTKDMLKSLKGMKAKP